MVLLLNSHFNEFLSEVFHRFLLETLGTQGLNMFFAPGSSSVVLHQPKGSFLKTGSSEAGELL